MTENTEALKRDREQSWCARCGRKPLYWYVEDNTLFTEAHRVCSTCKTPLTVTPEGK